MKNILTFIVAAVFVAGCATAGNAPKKLFTAKNLPGDYMRKMAGWDRYLKWRRAATVANFALEEALACETHLKALPGHWMQQFKAIEKDPAYKPEMPEEYIRQSKGEGLPPELR